jgi:hypothetical protein
MVGGTDSVRLKDGEDVSYAVVRAPDEEWADSLGDFLGHKEGLWHWQIEQSLRQPIGCDTYYYILHRAGVPFSGVMLAETDGVAILGHVYTADADRRKGACSLIFERLMDDFRGRGGRGMTLCTAFDSPAFRLYERFGFEGIEPSNGTMWYARDGIDAFNESFFASGDTEIEHFDWSSWPLSTVLYTSDEPAVIRAAPFGIVGRSSTEGPFLHALRAGSEGHAGQVSVLAKKDPAAVVGAASWGYDPKWPGQLVLDVFCHAHFWDRSSDLLSSLELPDADKHVVYADSGSHEKKDALTSVGFEQVAVLPEWIPREGSDTLVEDVAVMARKG